MDIATGVQKARRFVASLSVVTLVASLFVANVARAATYNDVPTDAWFYTYVEQLAAAGILDTTQTNYRPADLANRAEAAKLLVEAAGLTIDTSAGPSFTDVAPGVWYYQYVETAAKNGIVSGYKDAAGNMTGKFGPSDSVTREQFAKMAANALALTTKTDGGPHFPDVGTDRWSYSFVETLYNWSVVDGYPDGTFGPTKNINRAEIAKMVVGAMNPSVRGSSGAFNVQTATATSATMVDVMFSQNVEATSGAVATNYTVKDADGNSLSVTAATVSADKVTLTTASQTSNKPYVLTVAGVKSASAMALSTNTANFNGYNPLGQGGPLTVSLSASSPATMSAPKGASGVVFSCFDFTAGAQAVVVQSVSAHRFGAGKETDFNNIYFYNDAVRLTTGRTINSQTQNVDFSNVNVSIAAGGVAKLCVVGDFSATAAAASEHGFEIVAATAITTNASSVGGTFPVKGNVMRVAGGTAGTIKIGAYGSLGEGVVGQAGLRFAQARVEADNNEDMTLQRVAIYVRGSIRPTDLSNLKLMVEGSSDVLATVDSVATNALATFVLSKPLLIQKGQIKNLYFLADVKGRNGDDIKTYLDESTDLLAIGNTFGFGAQVDRQTTALKAGYDGAATLGAGDGFSHITLKGSQFTVAFSGPAAQDVASGQKAVHCLDFTITNNGPAVDIKNWVMKAEITTPAVPTAAGGLVNTVGSAQANYSLFKLASLNNAGQVSSTLLSGELPNLAGSDSTQDVTLSGSYTIDAGASFKAAIVMDVANTAGNGDKFKCTLYNLAGAPGADKVKVGSDTLGASAISPSSDIAGNELTVTAAGLTFGIGSNPPLASGAPLSSGTLVRGTSGATLVGITVRSGTSLDNTLQSLSVQGYLDANADNVFNSPMDPVVAGTSLKDVVTNVALYDGVTKISGALNSGNVDSLTGKVTFTGMSYVIPKGATKNLTLKGDINNSIVGNPRFKFGVVSASDITSIDQNGQTVSGIDVSQSGNCSPAGAGTACLSLNSGVIMTVASAGTPAVVQSGSANGALIGGLEAGKQLAKMKFSMANAAGRLEDFALAIQGDASSLSTVYVADSTCSTKLGNVSGYPVTGTVAQVTSLGLDLPVGDTILCFLGDVSSVKSSPSDVSGNVLSGSLTGLVLRDVTRLTSGGTEVSPIVNAVKLGGGGTVDATDADTAGTTAVATSICLNIPAIAAVPVVGDVLTFGTGTNGSELAFVSGATVVGACGTGGTHTVTVIRGAFGTTPRAFTLGTIVGKSKLGVAAAAGAVKQGDLIATSTGAANIDYYVALIDNPAVGADAQPVYGSVAAYVGANNKTAFTTHGNFSKVRKSYPVLSSNTVPADGGVAGGALSSNSQFQLMAVKIQAMGQLLPTPGQVELTPLNANTMSFTISGQLSAAAAGNYCAIYMADGTKLASVNTAGPGTLAATFTIGVLGGNDNSGVPASASGLTITAGTTTNVILKCSTTTSAAGQSISANLTGMTYGDSTLGNGNVNDSNLISAKFPISGPSFNN